MKGPVAATGQYQVISLQRVPLLACPAVFPTYALLDKPAVAPKP